MYNSLRYFLTNDRFKRTSIPFEGMNVCSEQTSIQFEGMNVCSKQTSIKFEGINVCSKQTSIQFEISLNAFKILLMCR